MSPALAWLYLLLSGILDVAWAFSMKKANGFTHAGWTVISLLVLAAFVALLGKAMSILPIGPAYAVWTGIGTIGAVLVGVFAFGEAFTPARLFLILMIMTGIVGLKLTS